MGATKKFSSFRCSKHLGLWNYLAASYVGGASYKDASDASGNPVFIAHEKETPARLGRRGDARGLDGEEIPGAG